MTTFLNDIRARYGDFDVLDGVTLQIDRREVVTVLGPSGSGKSTLLRVIAGLHPAASGTISIDGRDVTRSRPEERSVGFVPQDATLFPHMSVAANVGFGIPGLRRREAERDPRVRELLDAVELTGYATRMPHELSGGQQQRVAVARALARKPRVVLLDEPFGALDAGLRRRTREDVIDMIRAHDAGALLITHDQEEALSVSDRVALFRDGRIVQSGTPETVYRNPIDDWGAQFLGDTNVLPIEIVEGVAMSALGRVPLHENVRGPAHAIVRPEDLTIEAFAPERGDSTALSGMAYGEVTRTRYFGHDALIDIDVTPLSDRFAPLTVVSRVPGFAAPALGERVTLRVSRAVSTFSTQR